MCVYTKSKRKAPYPRVVYDTGCGLEFTLMEGYEFDSHKGCGGGGFSVRSSRLAVPPGNCMKCDEAITVKDKK